MADKFLLSSSKALVVLMSTLFLFSCSDDNIAGPELISTTKQYYETSINGLTTPLYHKHNTKSLTLGDTNLYLDWDNACSGTTIEGDFIVQVPIIGNSVFSAQLLSQNNMDIRRKKAACQSYCIFELDGLDVKDTYVYTIIEKGYKVKSNLLSSKTINDGFTIISDLSGAIIKETIHINGTAYNGHCRSYVLSELKNISPDISFYGYKTAEKYIVKTKGDAGDDDQFDCYWYGLVECRNCGCVYYANVLQNRSCPHCGEDVLNGMLVCNTCGNPIDDCICGYNPDDPYCNECHRLKENCICGKDDENLPDNPEPNLCGICGLPVGTCQHTQEK